VRDVLLYLSIYTRGDAASSSWAKEIHAAMLEVFLIGKRIG